MASMRKLVVLLAALCLASSCGSGGSANGAKDKKDGQYGSDFLTENKSTVAPPSTTAVTRPTTVAPRSKSSPLRADAPKTGSGPSEANPYSANTGATGSFAGVLLRPAPAKKILIEVQV